MSSSEPKCIFCGPNPEASFTPEHIIPESIGGRLVLRDAVCDACNTRLGNEVDSPIWRLADIVNAHEALGIQYNKNGIFKQHYSVSAIDDGVPVPMIVTVTDKGLHLQPRTHNRPEGRLYAGNNREQEIRKALSKRPGYDPEQCEQLIDTISAAPFGKVVDHPSQNLQYVRINRPAPECTIQKKKPEVARLCAKIVYEFLYRVFDDAWLLEHPGAPTLRDLAISGTHQDRVHVGRCPDTTSAFEPFHAIIIYLNAPMLMADVIFFGRICYRLTLLKPFAWNLPQQLSRITGISDIIGVECQQELKPVKRGLRWLTEDESNPQIEAW